MMLSLLVTEALASIFIKQINAAFVNLTNFPL
jgi:hypothetical protein